MDVRVQEQLTDLGPVGITRKRPDLPAECPSLMSLNPVARRPVQTPPDPW